MLRTCDHCCTNIENLSVTIDGHAILQGVNLHVNCGEVIAVIGPNGAGKTTLLKTILGELAYTGKMSFRLKGSSGLKPNLGYVPQKTFFDNDTPVSVIDFVAASISTNPVWLGLTKKDQNKIKTILAKFSAEHLLFRKIGELSGGELQRILLAVAMTPSPQLLLLDEPGAGVDLKGLNLFYKIVHDLKKQHDIAVVIVTHDLLGIAKYVDRMVLLNKTIIAQGEPNAVLSDHKTIDAFGLSLSYRINYLS